MAFSLLGFRLAGTGDPFIPSSFSLLKWEHLSYVYLTSVIWKQVTGFLGSCKQFQWAVMASLGRDGWRTETWEDLRQAVL